MIILNRVMVTGMGAVTPIGNDVESCWQSLVAGKCGIGAITKFDTTDFKVKVAAEVKDFEPARYMDKAELRKFDPFCQYAMGAAAQAVESSGILGKCAPEEVGVYFGSGIGGITTFEEQQKLMLEKGPRRVSPFFIPALIINMAGGLIAIKYNFQGAAVSSVTACATGNNAIGEAYRAIKHGYLTAALAGGAEAAIVPLGLAGFSNMKALSTCEDPAAACVPFDARRGGFVMGEGAGILLLESLEHALARKADIYAEIVGYGATCDAYHMTAPLSDGSGGAKAMAQALADGGVEPEAVDYINAHGTSTHLNDAGETAAVKTVFGPHAYQLAISSTKSMTGHMLGAAGAVEAIFTAMALKDGFIPATIHYQTPDPECDLDIVPNQGRTADIRCALSNSLGFGGHNGSLLFRKWEG